MRIIVLFHMRPYPKFPKTTAKGKFRADFFRGNMRYEYTREMVMEEHKILQLVGRKPGLEFWALMNQMSQTIPGYHNARDYRKKLVDLATRMIRDGVLTRKFNGKRQFLSIPETSDDEPSA